MEKNWVHDGNLDLTFNVPLCNKQPAGPSSYTLLNCELCDGTQVFLYDFFRENVFQ